MTKNILNISGGIKLDTVTIYSENQMSVVPCPWDNEKVDELVSMNEQIAEVKELKLPLSRRGRTTFDGEGRSVTQFYNEGTGPRYKTLFTTEHCTVQQTQGGTIIVKWNFRRRMNSSDIREAMERETPMITGFFRSRKEETVW